jgi:hypothetical protein
MEVGVVVISWQPTGGLVGDLIGLGREGFVLNEAAEGFGISEVFGQAWRWSYTCSQFLFVVTMIKTIALILRLDEYILIT